MRWRQRLSHSYRHFQQIQILVDHFTIKSPVQLKSSVDKGGWWWHPRPMWVIDDHHPGLA
jgi:hypothetical protein